MSINRANPPNDQKKLFLAGQNSAKLETECAIPFS